MLAASMWAAVLACTSAPDPGATEDGVVLDPFFEDAPLGESWVVATATDEAIGPYGGAPGWVALAMKRDIAAAVEAFGEKKGAPTARAHTEAAYMFRQAAMLSAYSLIEVYGKTPEPTDPVGVAHLLAVSHAITGDRAAAAAAAAALAATPDEATAAWHAPWAAWLGSSDPWPPDLSALPVQLPPPSAGGWPKITDLPHYSLPERGGSTASRDMADPGALVALALWHDEAAAKAAPDEAVAGKLKAMRSGYRLPVEAPAPAATGPLSTELLFASDLLGAGDADFLAEIERTEGDPASPEAISAVIAKHEGSSPIAWVAARSRTAHAFDHDKVVDLVADLRRELVARSERAAGGQLAHHLTFADVGVVGLMRSLALVAERQGDREASGLLRIGALERSAKATACPVGLLALAAWDASNRYPTRAQDILHAQAKRYPSIEVARYGLDVLGLRVGFERVGETAGM